MMRLAALGFLLTLFALLTSESENRENGRSCIVAGTPDNRGRVFSKNLKGPLNKNLVMQLVGGSLRRTAKADGDDLHDDDVRYFHSCHDWI